MNRTINAPTIKNFLVMAMMACTLFSCNQKVKEGEENIATQPDTSRDSEGDTFSIVAYDSNSGQIGGAGCSCVGFNGGIDFLSDLITDGTTNADNIVGAIHTQAAYNADNQNYARARMLEGKTPQEIVDETVAADPGSGTSASRQYGVVGVDVPGHAGFSGSSNGDYKNHIGGTFNGYTYSIQGNILDIVTGQDLLDDMEDAFNNTVGTLAEKLMAAMQAAKRVGGDNRCESSTNSGRTAFIQVLSPGETSPSLYYNTDAISGQSTTSGVPNFTEPIDKLQAIFDDGENTPFCRETISSFPYSQGFEILPWYKEDLDSDADDDDRGWMRDRSTTASSNTGPNSANEGTFYMYLEGSDVTGASDEAAISSPCFNFPSNHTIEMTFDYHMLGAAIGTLRLEATTNSGTTWTSLWTETGSQGSNWFNDQSVDLSTYAGQNVKFRFRGNRLTGSLDYESDMAIDDIQIDVQPISVCTNPLKTWNGSSWSPSGAPDVNTPVVIAGNYNTSASANGSFEACSVTVNAAATLTVGADSYMTVDTDIVVDGTLLVQHTGNVVQNSADALVTNNGTINVEVTTPILQTRDFMVMGSPMSEETRNDVFTDAFLVLNHNPNSFVPHPDVTAGGTNFMDDNGDFWSAYSGNITVGEGYIVRPQDGYTDPANEAYDMTYTRGTLNNGNVTRPVVYRNSPADINPDGTPNVFANPYASAISGYDLIDNNPLINEVYFWEHLTPPSSSIPGYNSINFSMGDISMYNLSGGVKAANDPGTSTMPNGVISTGQGFGVKAFGDGSMTFTNAMRLNTGNTTLRSADTENVDRIWLNVSSTKYEIGSNTLIAFNPSASEGFDPGFDSNRLANFLSIYSFLPTEDKELGIQTLGELEAQSEVKIGFASQIEADTEFKISIDRLEGNIISDTDIYLLDTFNNILTDLGKEEYLFTSNKGNWQERFILIFEPRNTLGAIENEVSNIIIYPNPTSGIVNISSTNMMMKSWEIYDLRGSLIRKELNTEASSTQIDIAYLKTGIYFLHIHTNAGIITKKIIRD